MVNVLGVDTSLRKTGVGVVSAEGSRMRSTFYGVIASPRTAPLSRCLSRLFEGVTELLDEWHPEAVAVEGAFFYRNAKTAMILGEARGTVIAACACGGVPVYEYAPRRVKQAVVGFGGAAKEQMREMMKALLGLQEAPPEDAADALAIAVCHLHSRTGHRALMGEAI